VSSYSALIRTPRIVPLYASMIVARLAIGIDGIAIVLFLRHEGNSFALAGATAGALALGSALGAPVAARLIDRLSARVLVWLALAHATGLVGLILLAAAKAPGLLLVPVAFLTGATLPTVSSVLRSAYATLLAHDRRLVSSGSSPSFRRRSPTAASRDRAIATGPAR
jgi:MFS family permease